MRTVLVLTLALVCAGCGGSRTSGKLRVVAAENVYGDIAAQIGGSHVAVTSILSDPSADPHLFEAGTRTGLAVAQASLVIENGAGYDAFVDDLIDSTQSHARVLTIADVLPMDTGNPHLWYDVERLPRIAAALERALAAADPAHAAAYRRGLARFSRSLAAVQRELARVREQGAGAPVAYTEPVPGYLVEELGLRNLAPTAFTRAIADGSEPPPAAVAAMTELIAQHRIRVLLYNSQAVSPLTTRLRDAALAARIGVVPVSETLPRGASYQQWQLAQLRALAEALKP